MSVKRGTPAASAARSHIRGLVHERLTDVEDHSGYSHAATRSRSALVVTFRSRRVALDPADATAGALDEPRAIRRVAAARDRAPQRVGEERLRRLHRDQVGAVERLEDAVAVDPLDGVGEGERRDDAVPALRERGQDATDDLVVDERAGGVVDEHGDSLVRNLRQREAHGLGARRAARDDGADLAGADLLGEEDRRLLPAGRSRHHDRVDPVGLVEPLHARCEERQLAERDECLGPVRTEALAAPCRGEDRPGGHSARRRTRPSPRRPSPSTPSSCRCPSP